jgi:hypothetical protein
MLEYKYVFRRHLGVHAQNRLILPNRNYLMQQDSLISWMKNPQNSIQQIHNKKWHSCYINHCLSCNLYYQHDYHYMHRLVLAILKCLE